MIGRFNIDRLSPHIIQQLSANHPIIDCLKPQSLTNINKSQWLDGFKKLSMRDAGMVAPPINEPDVYFYSFGYTNNMGVDITVNLDLISVELYVDYVGEMIDEI